MVLPLVLLWYPQMGIQRKERSKVKVLVIESSQQVLKHISFSLRFRWSNAVIVSADEARKGLELIEIEAPDLVMADFSVPGMGCVNLVSHIREFSDVPIIVLMAEGTEVDRAEVLENGADDCIAKPYLPIDVQAKVNALLRRTNGDGFKGDHTAFVSGYLKINFDTCQVFISGEPVKLTAIEYGLLCQLARNQGRVLPHGILLEKVWGTEYLGDSSLVKNHVYRLRKKLQRDGNQPQMILSERGIGYRFIPLKQSRA